MGIRIDAYIVFDDNTPNDLTPFTHEPSVWSLRYDYGLVGCGDRRFYAAIGYPGLEGYPQSLFPLRGIGEVALPVDIKRDLEGEEFVGWLTEEEIRDSLQHANIDEVDLATPVQVVLIAMRKLQAIYGNDRVRLVYALIP